MLEQYRLQNKSQYSVKSMRVPLARVQIIHSNLNVGNDQLVVDFAMG